ncbi:unnamed protein product [Ectocarpus sp. CCAP 1310/34]|nr:unnamed protein product [Ectocarpus sp. CCAP 1310/34]
MLVLGWLQHALYPFRGADLHQQLQRTTYCQLPWWYTSSTARRLAVSRGMLLPVLPYYPLFPADVDYAVYKHETATSHGQARVNTAVDVGV